MKSASTSGAARRDTECGYDRQRGRMRIGAWRRDQRPPLVAERAREIVERGEHATSGRGGQGRVPDRAPITDLGKSPLSGEPTGPGDRPSLRTRFNWEMAVARHNLALLALLIALPGAAPAQGRPQRSARSAPRTPRVVVPPV